MVNEALERVDLEQGTPEPARQRQGRFLRTRGRVCGEFMGSPNLLSGKTVKDVRDREIGEVKLADGRSVVCRFPKQLAADAPAVVSTRPEIISLTSPAKAVPDGWNSFVGRILTVDFQGYLSRCTVDIGNLTLQANVDSREGLAVGADVLLRFPHHEAIGLAQAKMAAN